MSAYCIPFCYLIVFLREIKYDLLRSAFKSIFFFFLPNPISYKILSQKLFQYSGFQVFLFFSQKKNQFSWILSLYNFFHSLNWNVKLERISRVTEFSLLQLRSLTIVLLNWSISVLNSFGFNPSADIRMLFWNLTFF